MILMGISHQSERFGSKGNTDYRRKNQLPGSRLQTRSNSTLHLRCFFFLLLFVFLAVLTPTPSCFSPCLADVSASQSGHSAANARKRFTLQGLSNRRSLPAGNTLVVVCPHLHHKDHYHRHYEQRQVLSPHSSQTAVVVDLFSFFYQTDSAKKKKLISVNSCF